MATYTLHVNIDPMILKNQSSDNLCIAKKGIFIEAIQNVLGG